METKEITRLVNRHKARTLSNLEKAGCPVIFVDAVASGLNWLRSDLQNNNGDERNDDRKEEINHNC